MELSVLQLEECRRLLSVGSANLDDHELEDLRNCLYQLAHVLINEFTKKSMSSPINTVDISKDRADL